MGPWAFSALLGFAETGWLVSVVVVADKVRGGVVGAVVAAIHRHRSRIGTFGLRESW